VRDRQGNCFDEQALLTLIQHILEICGIIFTVLDIVISIMMLELRVVWR
jgi:hypothetical protein